MSEDELNALASALRGLTPSARPLDRDALMYQAGRASGPRRTWLWPAATAASALITVGFGLAMWGRPAEVKTIERVVYVPALVQPLSTPSVETPIPEDRPAAPVSSPWEAPASRYEQVRDNVLRWGLDGLPAAPRTRHDVVSAKDLEHPF